MKKTIFTYEEVEHIYQQGVSAGYMLDTGLESPPSIELVIQTMEAKGKFDDSQQLLKKTINKRHDQAIDQGDQELSYMLGHYYQLRFSWVPQIIKRFLGADSGGLFTPHKCVLRKEVVSEWAKRYNIIK